MVVAGQTQIKLSDMQQFRTRFNLPANDPEVILVPDWPDPGIVDDDLGEANLDLQWAGAAAPDARILYVYSENVMDAVEYAIDQNLAPVISVSYGLCELQASRSQVLTLQAWARQGNAQGITSVHATIEVGRRRLHSRQLYCFRWPRHRYTSSHSRDHRSGRHRVHRNRQRHIGAAPMAPAADRRSPIFRKRCGTTASRAIPRLGGGGASIMFAKPVWQSGPGVPNDGARNVPDSRSHPPRKTSATSCIWMTPGSHSAVHRRLPRLSPGSPCCSISIWWRAARKRCQGLAISIRGSIASRRPRPPHSTTSPLATTS